MDYEEKKLLEKIERNTRNTKEVAIGILVVVILIWMILL